MAVDALVGDRGFLAMLRARQQYEELSQALRRLIELMREVRHAD